MGVPGPRGTGGGAPRGECSGGGWARHNSTRLLASPRSHGQKAPVGLRSAAESRHGLQRLQGAGSAGGGPGPAEGSRPPKVGGEKPGTGRAGLRLACPG